METGVLARPPAAGDRQQVQLSLLGAADGLRRTAARRPHQRRRPARPRAGKARCDPALCQLKVSPSGRPNRPHWMLSSCGEAEGSAVAFRNSRMANFPFVATPATAPKCRQVEPALQDPKTCPRLRQPTRTSPKNPILRQSALFTSKRPLSCAQTCTLTKMHARETFLAKNLRRNQAISRSPLPARRPTSDFYTPASMCFAPLFPSLQTLSHVILASFFFRVGREINSNIRPTRLMAPHFQLH